MSLLKELILVSEKAANIARLCRQEEHLFQLLIEEKKEGEANPRFVQDFKTLADVLIQEIVKYYIGKEFPEIQKNIKGEENNIFTNSLNETIEIKLGENQQDTEDLLSTVLNHDNKAAALLSQEIYKNIAFAFEELNIKDVSYSFDNLDNLGIWIDPIDATAEYIHGNCGEVTDDGIYKTGLRCVTVLIGVFDLTTGVPIAGVVNQPFHEIINERWKSNIFWGLTTPQLSYKAELNLSKSTKVITVSSSESTELKRKLIDAGFNLVEAAGAGYKIMLVIKGFADAYVLSKESTFFWDTCGPQAILQSLGGDLISYKYALSNEVRSINYIQEETGNCKIENYCNFGGIIAYRNVDVLFKILDAFK